MKTLIALLLAQTITDAPPTDSDVGIVVRHAGAMNVNCVSGCAGRDGGYLGSVSIDGGVVTVANQWHPDGGFIGYVREGTSTQWSCSLDAIGTTLTQCQAAPGVGLRLHLTDITIGSTTATAGQFLLRQGTGSNCGTGTASLFPSAATVARFAYPANNSASGAAKFTFTVPVIATANNAICVLCVATNTCAVQLQGYTAP